MCANFQGDWRSGSSGRGVALFYIGSFLLRHVFFQLKSWYKFFTCFELYVSSVTFEFEFLISQLTGANGEINPRRSDNVFDPKHGKNGQWENTISKMELLFPKFQVNASRKNAFWYVKWAFYRTMNSITKLSTTRTMIETRPRIQQMIIRECNWGHRYYAVNKIFSLAYG